MSAVVAPRVALSGHDLYLFREGTHSRLYEKLGARLVEGATEFAVWAPNAASVAVVGDFNGWDPRANPMQVTIPKTGGTLQVWFSPNTVRRTKSTKERPVDMADVFDAIDHAQSMVLFLLFNPGTPSILERVRQAESKATAAGKPLYVRGAISDARTAAEGAVNVFSRSAKKVDTPPMA